MNLVLSDDAANDIAAIFRYSKREYGVRQARVYGDGLVKMLRLVANRPDVGRVMHRFPQRFQKVTYRAHDLYFSVSDINVIIIRVLHQSRDAPRHLVF